MSNRIGRLWLHISNHLQGETTITPNAGNEVWAFTYDHRATQDAALPMTRQIPTYAWDGIFPAFEQHLPEMDLSMFPTAIWKEITRDHAGMLWVAGQHRLGRLRFTREGEAPPDVSPLRLTENDIASTTQGDDLLAQLISRMVRIPGVSGVQPKVLLPLLANNAEAPRALADTHLLKGNRADYPYATTVEAATLELAEAFELNVPPRTLSADGRLLAVKRFDLDENGQPRGFDEAASIMGLWARDKYTTSVEALQKHLQAQIPAMKKHAFNREFFSLIAFNLAVENGDAHLKNFGLLYDDPDDASLAPVYDVLTTTCFEGLDKDSPALPLGGRKVWDDWKPFTSLAMHRGLTRVEVRKILTRLADTLRDNMHLPEKYRQLVPAAAPVLLKAEAAWRRGLNRLDTYLHEINKK